MNILFDGNYLFHKSFSVFSQYYKGQDMAEVLQKPENRQVLIRKCIIDMCFCINKFKEVKRVAFVIDSTSWRYNFYANYKYAMLKEKDESYKWFLVALDEFEALLRKRGIIVSRVKGAEGDDLLYVWSIYFGFCLDEKLVIITGDSDIRQIMTRNVSLFNNNSKRLPLYCVPENEVFWNEYMETDVMVQAVRPFEVLLYKVVMGDTSDNIPKLKRGFGNVAFQNFIKFLGVYQEPKDVDITEMARWIASRFAEFTKQQEHDVFGAVYNKLLMTWLNLAVYNSNNYFSENGKSLLENMLDDVSARKDEYNYNKPYTLEQFYGMIIK